MKRFFFTIYQGLDKATLEMIAQETTAKAVWEALQRAFSREKRVKKVRLQALRVDFESLHKEAAELSSNYFTRVRSITY